MCYITSKKFFDMEITDIQRLMKKYNTATNFVGIEVNDLNEKERLWKIIKDNRNYKITIISFIIIVLTLLGTILKFFIN